MEELEKLVSQDTIMERVSKLLEDREDEGKVTTFVSDISDWINDLYSVIDFLKETIKKKDEDLESLRVANMELLKKVGSRIDTESNKNDNDEGNEDEIIDDLVAMYEEV